MSEQKTKQLLQLFYRESDRARLFDLEALPPLDTVEEQAMLVWLATKRHFQHDEIASQRWVKTCSAGYITELILHANGSLEEFTLFKRMKTTGEWQLIDGMIELTINKDNNQYKSNIVASLGSSIHAAIEYKNGALHSYLKLVQARPIDIHKNE
ncbi:hypothetical protein [Photobacterium nomapromontoriensis]|uniref:hypothetical protein n=1 Tax=Photobacterium nomapromontoriensis TaxID=2910237 RepID=UPI003D11F77D